MFVHIPLRFSGKMSSVFRVRGHRHKTGTTHVRHVSILAELVYVHTREGL